MVRAERAALVVLAVGATLAFGIEASARTETLRWTHPDPSGVQGFIVYWGAGNGSYQYTKDVGKPGTTNGVYASDIQVDDAADVWVAVTAYDADLESFYSNAQCRGPSGVCGSEPEPQPEPGGSAAAAVLGFRLWDASSSGDDTLIDTNFASGEQIDLAQHPCTAIEVVTNTYLADGGPGSVGFQFDGVGGSCQTPGVDFENLPPFTWEEDAGDARYACASSLTVPGSHTLTVTPYDGDSCTGAAGTPVSLTFSVLGASGGGGDGSTGGTLTAPGQPFLVSP